MSKKSEMLETLVRMWSLRSEIFGTEDIGTETDDNGNVLEEDGEKDGNVDTEPETDGNIVNNAETGDVEADGEHPSSW
jgi:hypothetical protein